MPQVIDPSAHAAWMTSGRFRLCPKVGLGVSGSRRAATDRRTHSLTIRCSGSKRLAGSDTGRGRRFNSSRAHQTFLTSANTVYQSSSTGTQGHTNGTSRDAQRGRTYRLCAQRDSPGARSSSASAVEAKSPRCTSMPADLTRRGQPILDVDHIQDLVNGPHSSRQLSSRRAPSLGARVGLAADNRASPPRRGAATPLLLACRKLADRRWLRCRGRAGSGLRPPRARWSG
jgi:hypothetical protein